MNNCIERINEELKIKKGRNPAFSLRAFASQIGVSPAHLSQILNYKRPLTLKTAKKLTSALNLSPLETDHFLSDLYTSQDQELELTELNQGRLVLKEDQFKIISDWEHFAILSLSELKNSRFDARWLARRLNISLIRATDARDRLMRLGIIEKQGKSFRQVAPPLSTTDDFLDLSIQKHHLQNLELAADKLNETPVDYREFTSVTLATHPQKIKEAKKLIRNFKRKLTRFLEDTDKTEVYTFSIQLFPLTFTKDKK